MPSVSVIIPAYNAASIILETIQSIQAQTYTDFEIIVVNDGSTDNTLEVLESIQEPRMKVFTYPNGGVCLARNRGVARSSGEFLAFIDNDDIWTNDKLELGVKIFQEKRHAGAVYSWFYNMIDDDDGTRRFLPTYDATFEGNVHTELLLRNFIGNGSNLIVRREVFDSVGGFDPALCSPSDWDFSIRVSKEFEFAVVPKVQVFYRKNPGSMSVNNVIKMEQETLIALENAFSDSTLEEQALKPKSLAYVYRYLADLASNHKSNIQILRYAQEKLWMSIKLNPATLKNSYTRVLIAKVLVRRYVPEWLENIIANFVRRSHLQND